MSGARHSGRERLGFAVGAYAIALSAGGSSTGGYSNSKRWPGAHLRTLIWETSSKSPQGTTRYVPVGAQAAFGSSAGALSMRSTPRRGARGDPNIPTKPLIKPQKKANANSRFFIT